MTNEQIDLLAESIADEVPTLIGDLAPHIREAAAAVLEETQEKENAKPMLNISFGVGINLATDPPAYTIKAAVSVKRTVSTDLVLRDPNQPDLPLGDREFKEKAGGFIEEAAAKNGLQVIKNATLKVVP